jgi:hypothetical protein
MRMRSHLPPLTTDVTKETAYELKVLSHLKLLVLGLGQRLQGTCVSSVVVVVIHHLGGCCVTWRPANSYLPAPQYWGLVTIKNQQLFAACSCTSLHHLSTNSADYLPIDSVSCSLL